MATKIWLGTDATSPNDVTVAANWSPANQPTTGDSVVITGTVNIDGATLSASGDLAGFTVRDYSGAIGSEATPLTVDLGSADPVDITTSGKAYIDFNASAVDVTVRRTASANFPACGLHLTGAGVNNVNVYGDSSVFILETIDEDINTYDTASRVHTDAAADAVNFTGPGLGYIYGDLTNMYADGGTVNYYGGAAPTTVQAENGGTVNYWASQNITNANAYGGTVNLKGDTAARTVTNADVRSGGTIDFGRNWTPTNTPSSEFKITPA